MDTQVPLSFAETLQARQMAAAYKRTVQHKYIYSHWRHDRDFEEYLKCKIDHVPDPFER
jgi:hypothetical protein